MRPPITRMEPRRLVDGEQLADSVGGCFDQLLVASTLACLRKSLVDACLASSPVAWISSMSSRSSAESARPASSATSHRPVPVSAVAATERVSVSVVFRIRSSVYAAG